MLSCTNWTEQNGQTTNATMSLLELVTQSRQLSMIHLVALALGNGNWIKGGGWNREWRHLCTLAFDADDSLGCEYNGDTVSRYAKWWRWMRFDVDQR